MMTSEQLDALQAAAEAATAGPWEADCFEDWGTQPQSAVFVGDLPLTSDNQTGHVFKQSDAKFIAAANPAVILELVAAHRAALSRIARVEALHAPVPMVPGVEGSLVCDGCEDPVRFVPYPCPTIRALTEGEPSE